VIAPRRAAGGTHWRFTWWLPRSRARTCEQKITDADMRGGDRVRRPQQATGTYADGRRAGNYKEPKRDPLSGDWNGLKRRELAIKLI
jgi:hypothetical protein